MKEHPRRCFIGSTSSLAVASLSTPVGFLLNGCNRRAEAPAQSDPDFEPGYLNLPRTGGLMIRHLVTPGGVRGSKRVLDWIAENLPKDT